MRLTVKFVESHLFVQKSIEDMNLKIQQHFYAINGLHVHAMYLFNSMTLCDNKMKRS